MTDIPLYWCDCKNIVVEGGMCECGSFGYPELLSSECSIDNILINTYREEEQNELQTKE